MKQVYYLRAAVITMFLLFLFQCRTSEESINLQNAETNEKIDAFVRFEQQLKKAKKSKTISENGDSYAPPFIEIIKQFFENHPDYHADFTQNVGTIDFRVTSQTIGEDEKMVLFPILKENKVNAVLFCRINKDKNFVKFSIVKDKLSEFGFPIDEFQNYYNKISIKKNMISAREVAIPEVVITKLRRSDHPFSEIFIPDWSWTAGGGGSGSKMNGSGGVHNGGGGGRNGNNDNGANAGNDPCSQTKNLVNKEAIKSKITELENYIKNDPNGRKTEKGYQETKDGTILEGQGKDSSVAFSVEYNSLGGIHSHLTFGMFSPKDLLLLTDFARVQNYTNPAGSTEDYTGNAYLGMVFETGNYFIKFTGGSSGLPAQMTEAEKNTFLNRMDKIYKGYISVMLYNKDYTSDNVTLNQRGYETLFFKTLEEMGLSGKIQLIKEEDGKTSTVNKNSDGTVSANPC